MLLGPDDYVREHMRQAATREDRPNLARNIAAMDDRQIGLLLTGMSLAREALVTRPRTSARRPGSKRAPCLCGPSSVSWRCRDPPTSTPSPPPTSPPISEPCRPTARSRYKYPTGPEAWVFRQPIIVRDRPSSGMRPCHCGTSLRTSVATVPPSSGSSTPSAARPPFAPISPRSGAWQEIAFIPRKMETGPARDVGSRWNRRQGGWTSCSTDPPTPRRAWGPTCGEGRSRPRKDFERP